MEDNGTYRWPGNQPQKPKKTIDLKKISRTATMVVCMLLAVLLAGTCFYTVDDKQQAVVTTFGAVTDVTDAGVHFKLPFGIPLEVFARREATCRAVFGNWGFFRTMHEPVIAPSC